MKDLSVLDDKTLSDQLQQRLKNLPKDKTVTDAELLLNDLHIHQIELEMQNRELRKSQRELEVALDKYADLYDFAPVGYVTFDIKGCIQEINLTACHMLGMNRAHILNKPFTMFLSPGHINTFFNHLKDASTTLQKERVELTLKPANGGEMTVRIDINPHRSPNTELTCRGAIIDISENKRMAQQLKWEQDISTSLIDTARSAILTLDSLGNIVKSNRYFETLTGAPKNIITGSNLVDKFIPPSDQTKAHAKLKVVCNGGAGNGFISRLLTKNGADKIIEWRCSPIVDDAPQANGTVLAIGHDISERVAAETALAEQEQLLRQLIDAIPALVAYLDTDLHYVYCNNTHENWLSVDRDQINGTNIRETFGDTAYDVLAPLLDDGLQGKRVSASVQLPVAGQIWNVFINVIPDPAPENKVQGILLVITDISELKQEQDNMLKRLNLLSHESRLMMLGQMTSEIAHEINQPLAAIGNYASAGIRMHANGSLDDANTDNILQKISRQVERVNEIIVHLRKLSQKRELRFETLEVNQLIRDALRLVEAESHWYGAALHDQLTDKQLLVRGDPVLLEQVILNICRNALESASQVGVDTPQVTVSTTYESDNVIINITDNGPGINPELIKDIFSPFVTTKDDSVGLGLSVAKSIIDAHHGNIS
ncbi:MAG: PAS domain S-box protein, partial [Gammaproteobacteria bacterium]